MSSKRSRAVYGPSGSAEPIRELDRVVLTSDIMVEGRSLPRGSIGTVVATWGSGEAFEVEFSAPHACLTTLEKALVTKR